MAHCHVKKRKKAKHTQNLYIRNNDPIQTKWKKKNEKKTLEKKNDFVVAFAIVCCSLTNKINRKMNTFDELKTVYFEKEILFGIFFFSLNSQHPKVMPFNLRYRQFYHIAKCYEIFFRFFFFWFLSFNQSASETGSWERNERKEKRMATGDSGNFSNKKTYKDIGHRERVDKKANDRRHEPMTTESIILYWSQ